MNRRTFFEPGWQFLYLGNCLQAIWLTWTENFHVSWAVRGAWLGLAVFGLSTWGVAAFAMGVSGLLLWVFLVLIAGAAWFTGSIIEPLRASRMIINARYFIVTLFQGLLAGIPVGILWAAIATVLPLLG